MAFTAVSFLQLLFIWQKETALLNLQYQVLATTIGHIYFEMNFHFLGGVKIMHGDLKWSMKTKTTTKNCLGMYIPSYLSELVHAAVLVLLADNSCLDARHELTL